MTMLSDKGFTDVISEINKGTSVRREQIQSALLFCAYHAQASRNTDPAIRLFAVIGNETNQRAISHWLSLNAPIYFKEGMVKLADKKQKEWTGTLVEYEQTLKAAAPWYKMAKRTNTTSNVWDHEAKYELLRKYVSTIGAEAKKNNDLALVAMVAELDATMNNAKYK